VFSFIHVIVTKTANLIQQCRIYVWHQFSTHTNDA